MIYLIFNIVYIYIYIWCDIHYIMGYSRGPHCFGAELCDDLLACEPTPAVQLWLSSCHHIIMVHQGIMLNNVTCLIMFHHF